ncbi:MAG: 3,4-dihydroxy-2-butanone-4-phosphate synthase, partial [Bacillota bacterium]|nr:3,4-dihydroxy-2-butanone-4-phosphate synthase [Bacillota bacterium]
MFNRLSVTAALDILKQGGKIVLTDEGSPDDVCHYAAIASQSDASGCIGAFCPFRIMPSIVLGYEEFGVLTGIRKNAALEYDTDFVNMNARKGDQEPPPVRLARLIRALVAPGAAPEQFRMGGEFQVVSSKNGGVLRRAAPAEAIVDLCRLAAAPAAGLLYEMVDQDGRSLTYAELAKAEETFDVLEIAELIRHRRATDVLVERIAAA